MPGGTVLFGDFLGPFLVEDVVSVITFAALLPLSSFPSQGSGP